MPTERAEPLTDALDRLYGEPLEGFLAKRKELAAELRAAGHKEAARALSAAPKPTRTAWALDQVARRAPEAVRAMLQARDAAAEVPGRGDADALRAALRDYRARVGELVQRARGVLSAAGFDASATQLRRMAETLQVASAPGSDARARLEAGTLAHDVEVEDPFAGLAAPEAPGEPPLAEAPPSSATATAASAKDAAGEEEPTRAGDDEAARQARVRAEAHAQRQAFLEAAEPRATALSNEAREARAAARVAETAAERAHEESERTGREADRAQKDADRARKEAERAQNAAESARRQAEDARTRAEGARREAERARDAAVDVESRLEAARAEAGALRTADAVRP
jgi:hypothetical protein